MHNITIILNSGKSFEFVGENNIETANNWITYTDKNGIKSMFKTSEVIAVIVK